MTDRDNSAETVTERNSGVDAVVDAPGSVPEAVTPGPGGEPRPAVPVDPAEVAAVTGADISEDNTDAEASDPVAVEPETETASPTAADVTTGDTDGAAEAQSAAAEAPAADQAESTEAAEVKPAAEEAPAKPAAKPVPKPAALPSAVAKVAHAAPVAAPVPTAAPVDALPPVAVASADPSKWGRVDEEGTVYVRTADGERVVGSWQAGEPAEGLAHFARRFDDIRTEVELLETRLAAGSGDPKHAATNAKHIKDSLAEAHVVGDLVGLEARLDQVIAHAAVALDHAKHARDEARAGSVARKEELVTEAEQLAEESTQWKVAGDRLRQILDEWKTIKGVDRKTDEQLWRRFSKARDTFNRRRGSHFADLDRQRSTAKSRKQELVEEAELLSESDDWGPTAARYKDLMLEWKAAGRAPKDADDTLWQRFRAAQDKFFSRRSSVFDERDAEFAQNAKLKEELLAEAEKINVKGDLDAARAQLHKIQEKWELIGKVPRERIRELEGRMRTVEEKVRTAADAQWRKTDPEAEARAAQFRERVEQFEAQAAKARAAGDKRRAEQAEAQAAQWREWLAAAEQAVASR
ncbi:protein of unknown function [Actinokineospora alba]|uniref:DUF349 domain-containing protein n=1 Tax=Actinokineospora alba TaxID=504798 RepID=A0A1H0JHY6_9PSEU|nr:uncharacterized protein DUF349 [Actinokineospora alba]SDH96143.1 protein of unknown function [Actinokineospora alba]SDO43039.1 protein of unknown function [Actinokineospora alba]